MTDDASIGKEKARLKNQEVVAFFAHGQVIEMVNLDQFEDLLEGMHPVPGRSKKHGSAVYIVVNPRGMILSLVFFKIPVDEGGICLESWRLPLQRLAETAVLGPDLGGGRVTLASFSQCPISWHRDSLWDPSKEDYEAIVASIDEFGENARIRHHLNTASEDEMVPEVVEQVETGIQIEPIDFDVPTLEPDPKQPTSVFQRDDTQAPDSSPPAIEETEADEVEAVTEPLEQVGFDVDTDLDEDNNLDVDDSLDIDNNDLEAVVEEFQSEEVIALDESPLEMDSPEASEPIETLGPIETIEEDSAISIDVDEQVTETPEHQLDSLQEMTDPVEENEISGSDISDLDSFGEDDWDDDEEDDDDMEAFSEVGASRESRTDPAAGLPEEAILELDTGEDFYAALDDEDFEDDIERTMRNERQAYRNQIQELQQEVERQRTLNERLQRRLLEGGIKNGGGDQEQLTAQIAEMEERMKRLVSQVESLEEENQELQQEVDELIEINTGGGQVESSGASDVIEQIKRHGLVSMAYHPGAGHLHLDADEILDYLKDPLEYVAECLNISRDHYIAWMAHDREGRCTQCGQSVEREPDPKVFVPGFTDRCSEHQGT